MIDQYPYRDKDYINFIRQQPCCVTAMEDSESENIAPHHTEARGVGTKCSDYKTVPLIQSKHLELHQVGQRKFYDKYGINFEGVIIQCLSKYIRLTNQVDNYA